MRTRTACDGTLAPIPSKEWNCKSLPPIQHAAAACTGKGFPKKKNLELGSRWLRRKKETDVPP
ncbi:MAG: hypothetical protein ACYSUC_02355 [Planctomycetota bacterium]